MKFVNHNFYYFHPKKKKVYRKKTLQHHFHHLFQSNGVISQRMCCCLYNKNKQTKSRQTNFCRNLLHFHRKVYLEVIWMCKIHLNRLKLEKLNFFSSSFRSFFFNVCVTLIFFSFHDFLMRFFLLKISKSYISCIIKMQMQTTKKNLYENEVEQSSFDFSFM